MISTEQSPLSPPQAYARLIFLAIFSILTSVIFFMGVLTPFPLCMATLLYGRKIGFSMGVICLALIFVVAAISHPNPAGPVIFVIYALGFTFSIFLSEIIKRNIHPVKGILKVGSAFVVLSCVLAVGSIKLLPKPFVEVVYENAIQISQQFAEEKEKIKDLPGVTKEIAVLDKNSKPHLLTKEVLTILQSLPGKLFSGIFFILWLTMYLLLKANESYHFLRDYQFNEKDFTHFKVPEFVVWPVIALLGLLLLEPAVVGEQVHLMSLNLIECLGIFYLFQGFGIYLEFLNLLKITGFVRSFLVMFTIFTGWWVLAALGFFDMWVNFRKIFAKKMNKDDNPQG